MVIALQAQTSANELALTAVREDARVRLDSLEFGSGADPFSPVRLSPSPLI